MSKAAPVVAERASGRVFHHPAGREGVVRGKQQRIVGVHQMHGGPAPLIHQDAECVEVAGQFGRLGPAADSQDWVGLRSMTVEHMSQ